MTVIIDGTNLTIEHVLQLARFSEKIELHPSPLEQLKASREFNARKIKIGRAQV